MHQVHNNEMQIANSLRLNKNDIKFIVTDLDLDLTSNQLVLGKSRDRNIANQSHHYKHNLLYTNSCKCNTFMNLSYIDN